MAGGAVREGGEPVDLEVFAADADAATVVARYVLGCLLAVLLG